MNTVQKKTKTITRVELRMYGPITARDLSDFVHQVNNIYRDATGHADISDDAYYVTGDDEGLAVTFEVKGKN